jgi:membrane-associated phospholipid phosphatase
MISRKYWLGGTVAASAIVAVLLCVFWVDKPVATLAYAVFGRLSFLSRLAGTPGLFGPLTAVIGVVLILRRIIFLPISLFDVTLAQSEISLVATKLVLWPLKALFGRTWPLYGEPSYIIDGAYGFNLLKGGPEYASFPSGHAASVFVLCAVFWTAYPRYRAFYIAGVASVALALVVGDFHFVSDVIAGALLGGGVGASVVAAWRWIVRQPLRSGRRVAAGENDAPAK